MSTRKIFPSLDFEKALASGQVESIRRFCAANHPATIAEALAALAPDKAWDILTRLDPHLQAETFTHLDPEYQVRVLELLNRRQTADLLAEMSPDDRVDLFKSLPAERQEVILPAMAKAEREDIRRLSAYPEGTAGSVMTSDYATLFPELTASEAVEHLRGVAPDTETIYYAYIVDHERRLLGFVSLKDLILAPRRALVADIMHRETVFVRADDDQEAAARLIQKFDLLALPVVDGNEALVGIITHDDALDVITQEQTEDMEKFMAITGSHESGVYLTTPAWVHFRNRATWVVGLAALGLISGLIIHSFEHTLMKMMILALYMPMVADTGGNTGSQSATVVVRALALGEVAPRDILRVLAKELKIALLMAGVLGALSWAKVMFLSHGSVIPAGFSLARIGLAIAVALGLQVITATAIGALLPLAAARVKLDPAVVASPALTTIVDISGLLIYFFTAKWMLGI